MLIHRNSLQMPNKARHRMETFFFFFLPHLTESMYLLCSFLAHINRPSVRVFISVKRESTLCAHWEMRWDTGRWRSLFGCCARGSSTWDKGLKQMLMFCQPTSAHVGQRGRGRKAGLDWHLSVSTAIRSTVKCTLFHLPHQLSNCQEINYSLWENFSFCQSNTLSGINCTTLKAPKMILADTLFLKKNKEIWAQSDETLGKVSSRGFAIVFFNFASSKETTAISSCQRVTAGSVGSKKKRIYF